MLFRRNKIYKKEIPSQAKKSLLERLVIIDADGIDSPESVAEKLQEDTSVEARVVRVRSFAPGRRMSNIPVERTINMDESEAGKNAESEAIHEAPRPLHIERFENAVSEIDEEESEQEAAEEQENEDEGVESVDIGSLDAAEVPSEKKFFDILERAREQEAQIESGNVAQEQVRIIYRVPKRSYGVDATRNAIHNELIERINGSLNDVSVEQPAILPQQLVISVEERPQDIQQNVTEQSGSEAFALEDEIRKVVGNDTSDEHILEIIQGALAESVRSGEIVQTHSSNESRAEELITEIEDVRDLPQTDHFQKILFPEEYFYANDGTVIKTAAQLHEALQNMHIDTYNHHAVSRGTNDFANWIEGVYGHADCARRLKGAGGKEDMRTILELYLQ